MCNFAGFAAFTFAFFICALPAHAPRRDMLAACTTSYAVSESFGCGEVFNACKTRKRMSLVVAK